ncbi:SDR family NAD(P)-dependent oxidoreductase [Ketobacter sp. MCCC 1A13808]|uniref:SDR family NAD(P)-dependent oxidoreductase n=1 Tax=Ketobacter sp. MCCC 1A13808 TaxID=2602738 RepID=UPI001321F70D|nr:SDR family NAD(P)-dependent oxidoreductase [Ketobacter sp. MCCC 1A13808]MVF13426.1 SDR family NAD(P)-dependent oxidoreductase [Ketobacter sp. MCCC 1A13808]
MNSPAALITGAGTRLGSLFARHMAALGYDVAIHCNSSQDGAKQLARELQSTGRQCEVFSMDFSEAFDADEFILQVQARFPGLECIINNASAYEAAPTAGTSRELLEAQFRVNLVAPFLLAGSFKRYCGQGQVINILDNKIAYHQYQYAAYLLSKKSLADFTKMAALEFAPEIRVNGIAPGVTLPGETRGNAYVDWRIAGIPLGKKGSDEQLTNSLSYLLQNDFLTGQILYVDGGESVNQVGRNHENYPDSA